MDDSASVHIFQRAADLNEPVENLGLCEITALLLLLLDVESQIADYRFNTDQLEHGVVTVIRRCWTYLHSTP
jgi:hypothetical protein